MGAAGVTRTVGETSASLLEWGSAYLPALRAVEQEREGETALLEAGYGVLRDGRLVGYLDGEGARGLELLTGRTAADILEIELPSGRTVVRLTGAAVQWSPEFQGNDLKRLHLTCRVTAALARGTAAAGGAGTGAAAPRPGGAGGREAAAGAGPAAELGSGLCRGWQSGGPGGSGPLGEAEGPVDTAVFHGAGGDLSGGLPGSPVSRPAEWEERRGGSR